MTHDSVRLQEGVENKYQILDVIEFTSTRKCMSVIVKCPDGRIDVIVKGSVGLLIARGGGGGCRRGDIRVRVWALVTGC